MISIVHKLRKCRGSNAKLIILDQAANNYDWQKALVAMYNDSINYYIGSVPDITFVDDHEDYSDMFRGLDVLAQKAGTMQDRKALALELSREYGEIFRLILGGSLKANVGIATINKSYPGLIPTFDIMKAEDVPIPRYPILYSLKYDGVRLLSFVYAGTVELRTSTGKLLQVDSLIETMKGLPDGVYDGELVHGNGLQIERSKITGSVNKILLGSATDIEDYTFVIFDYVDLEAWAVGFTSKNYNLRLREAHKILDLGHQSSESAQERLRNIKIIDQGVAENIEDIETAFTNVLAAGYEGLICRYLEDPYLWERTPTMIKKKAIKECVLTCVGVVPGKGKYEGAIGALICEGYMESGTEIVVKVGAGLSDFDRERPAEEYVGERVEILYNTIIQAEGALVSSLFLPRFNRLVNKKDT